MGNSPAAAALLRLLGDPLHAVEPRLFPADRLAAADPGLYAWWAGGTARSSTFRLTISALLAGRLGLAAAGGKLLADSNAVVTEWIADHLRVAIAPYPDRDTLGEVEAEVPREAVRPAHPAAAVSLSAR